MPYEVQSLCEKCQMGDVFVIGNWPEHLGVFVCATCRCLVNIPVDNGRCPGCGHQPGLWELYDYSLAIPYQDSRAALGEPKPGPACPKCLNGSLKFEVAAHLNMGLAVVYNAEKARGTRGKQYIEKNIFILSSLPVIETLGLSVTKVFAYFHLDVPTSRLVSGSVSYPIFCDISIHIKTKLLFGEHERFGVGLGPGDQTPSGGEVLLENCADYATNMDDLAGLYKVWGQYGKAEAYYRCSKEARKALGEDHPDYASSLYNLAELGLWTGKVADAEPLARQALAIKAKALGEGHPACARTLSVLGKIAWMRDDYAAAEPLYRRALEACMALGENHPDHASSLFDLAHLYRMRGNYAAAEPLYRRALEARRAALGEDHEDYLDTMIGMAGLCRAMGDYAAAEPFYQAALQTSRRIWGEHSETFASCTNNYALLNKELGNYDAALRLFSQALGISRAASEDHPLTAVTLSNLASLYHEMGDYANAMSCARQAYAIHHKSPAEWDFHSLSSSMSLATVLKTMGDYAPAEGILREALENCRKRYGERHPWYVTCLSNLAVLLGEAKRDDGRPLLLQALEVSRDALGEGHPDYARVTVNLAMSMAESGDYASAEQLLLRAREVIRKALGPDHPSYASCLVRLAGLHVSNGRFAEAAPLYLETLAVRRAAWGEDHPHYADALHGLAAAYVATGRPPEALPLMIKASAIDDRTIGQIFSIGDEYHRDILIYRMMHNSNKFLSIAVRHCDTEVARTALDLVLRRKAIGSDASAVQRNAVLGGRYPALVPLLREFTSLKHQIARKMLNDSGAECSAPDQELLHQWQAKAYWLEGELVRQIPEMDLEQKLRASDRRAVALGLPEGVALIEFIRFPVFDFLAVTARGEPEWLPDRYLAFVLNAGEPDDVRMIDLGEAESIDRLIADFRADLLGEGAEDAGRGMEIRPRPAPPLAAEADSGSALRVALLDPLSSALGGRTRLLLAPDSGLTRLPFEVLPTEDGHRMIDGYELSYLSCGRDVLRFGAASTGHPTAPLVVADPDFDLEIEGGPHCTQTPVDSFPPKSRASLWSRLFGRARTASVVEPLPTPPSDPAVQPPGRRSRDLDPGACHFDRLPGTRAEGEQIAELLGVQPWLGAAAQEGRIKSDCHSPRILHLATHGFFLRNQTSAPERRARGPGLLADLAIGTGRLTGPFPEVPTSLPDPSRDPNLGDRAPELAVDMVGGWVRLSGPLPENPLLRSGLALAGANTWLRSGDLPAEAEDGLLTAEDITGLDLLSTELVVLSACETGLGELRTGEGVFGLRRAFFLAGAKTLVMSLWRVPDEPTRELMEDFYRHILAGRGRADALREAQRIMKVKYPNPYYWGAFICQGDPGPLGLTLTPQFITRVYDM